jgi:hypothetical protein
MSEMIELSRPVAVASGLGASAADALSFFRKPILLTGEKEILATRNGRDCFRSALLLLIRMAETVTVDVSAHPRAEEIRGVVDAFRIHQVKVVSATPRFQEFAAVLNVGGATTAGLPVVAVNSNGWTFRVTSNGVPIESDCAQSNPIGALAAAAMGASEVFKILIRLNPKRGEPLRGYCYSLWSYELSNDPGPEIARDIILPSTVLFGAGAIGNGIILLLRDLVASGELSIVDRQAFGPENLGTCVLLKLADIGKQKAEVLSREIPIARHFSGEAASFIASMTKAPRICLNGLDNIEARHQVQEIWPDLIIDGAIGPTSCEATLHPWGPDLSCLLCDFAQPSVSALRRESEFTGLAENRLADPMSVVSEADVADAPDEKKEWLRDRIGHQICSVMSEAELAKLTQEQFEERFEPSVPFVASLSAVMVVTELVRYLGGSPPVLETGFQFDVLVGPHNGIRKAHSRKQNCLCVTRKTLIQKLCDKRKQLKQA